MVRCQVLDDGVELGGSQSLDRGSFRPNLEDVRGTVHLRSTTDAGPMIQVATFSRVYSAYIFRA